MTNGTQGDREISNKGDRLEEKWTACGLVRDHVAEAGPADPKAQPKEKGTKFNSLRHCFSMACARVLFP